MQMNCISNPSGPSAILCFKFSPDFTRRSPGCPLSPLLTSLLALALTLPLFLFPPPARAQSSPVDKPPHVVASFFPAYCFASSVAGTNAVVELLGSGGEGPHSHQLTPSELRKLQNADIVFINGLGLEPWVGRLRAVARKTGRPRVVECAAGLESQLIRASDAHDHEEEGDHKHDHHGFDPHIWLDPVLAMQAATNIAVALTEAAPGRKVAFEKGLAAYSEKLTALHAEISTVTRGFGKRGIVTYHDAFPYFLKRYNLQLVGVIQTQADGSALPKSLSKLSKRIRSDGIRVIFAEPQFNQRLAERLAKDLGVQVDSLDTLETGPLKPDGYEEAMRRNLRTLERHLR